MFAYPLARLLACLLGWLLGCLVAWLIYEARAVDLPWLAFCLICSAGLFACSLYLAFLIYKAFFYLLGLLELLDLLDLPLGPAWLESARFGLAWQAR